MGGFFFGRPRTLAVKATVSTITNFENCDQSLHHRREHFRVLQSVDTRILDFRCQTREMIGRVVILSGRVFHSRSLDPAENRGQERHRSSSEESCLDRNVD